VSQSSSSISLPAGSIRVGFETAARAHQAARDGRVVPAARPIEGPQPETPVETAIANAARATSVDFNYLLAQAEVESSLDPDARAATSSATGLYQFIDSTWLGTVKKHGERFGLGALANEITLTPLDGAKVADPARRSAILALRNDPQVASLMAAGLAEDNRAHLMPILGRQPSHGELYLAHFLGADGAGRFLSEMQADPGQSAPALFARPAAANRAIFYNNDGAPRSLAQVMDVIEGKLNRALSRASDGQAAHFARADHLPTARSITHAPTIIADDGARSLGLPSPLTQASLPPLPRASRRAAMSQVLGTAFGGDLAAAPAQVRHAYGTLKAFGL